MKDYYREFGLRVRDARGDRSQLELAAAAGLNRAAIANIERGRNRVTLDILDKLARALDTSPSVLLPVTQTADGPSEDALLPTERSAVELIRARAGLPQPDDDAPS